jgi:hypothetical protein
MMTSKEISKVNAAATLMSDLAAAIEKAGKTLDASQVVAILDQMKEIVESE